VIFLISFFFLNRIFPIEKKEAVEQILSHVSGISQFKVDHFQNGTQDPHSQL